MLIPLRYGHGTIAIEVSDEKLLGSFRGPTGAALEDSAAAIRHAFEAPLAAPPWARSLVTSDNLAVVFDHELLPHFERLVIPMTRLFREAAGDTGSIGVICTPGADPDAVARITEDSAFERIGIEFEIHDPDASDTHAYLATTEDGRRIYLNRRIADADAVIAVARAGFDSVVGFRGPTSVLFPDLSNAASLLRSRLMALDRPIDEAALRGRQGCDEVAWLAGLFYGVNVALDRDGEIEDLWMGAASEVQQAGDAYSMSRWTFDRGAEPPELVVASVAHREGPAQWSAVAAALETAASLVKPEGRIALLANVERLSGPSALRLVDADNPWDVLAALRESDAVDMVATAQCARALSSCRIHLLSRLDAKQVEAMAMVPLSSERELANLIDRSLGCFVLEDADRARTVTATS